jgi:hypothetical protein
VCVCVCISSVGVAKKFFEVWVVATPLSSLTPYPMEEQQSKITFASKVIAALAAMIPLVGAWDALESKLTVEQARLVQNPLIAGPLIFGSAFASNGDPKATVTAMVIAYLFIEMYRGNLGPYRETPEWKVRRKKTF